MPICWGVAGSSFTAICKKWDDLLVVTLTEFGFLPKRTEQEGPRRVEVMFGQGWGQGCVYNCDDRTWEDNAMFSARDRTCPQDGFSRRVWRNLSASFWDSREQLTNGCLDTPLQRWTTPKTLCLGVSLNRHRAVEKNVGIHRVFVIRSAPFKRGFACG